ncbi:MAG: hypothetical protein MO853_00415 [Candidatus Protistobacter heckmanni]|nr:hypothetical protein [Candidatus Protistobacter heckmanni]
MLEALAREDQQRPVHAQASPEQHAGDPAHDVEPLGIADLAPSVGLVAALSGARMRGEPHALRRIARMQQQAFGQRAGMLARQHAVAHQLNATAQRPDLDLGGRQGDAAERGAPPRAGSGAHGGS